MKSSYHYEWAAYTDNLCYGRVFICKGRNRQAVEQEAVFARKGCYVIERKRIPNN